MYSLISLLIHKRLRSDMAGWWWCYGIGAAGRHGRGGGRQLPSCDGLAIPGTAMWLACCSRTIGAWRACLGLAGLCGSWCAPAALSGRRPPRGGGGGGFLPHGCGATVPDAALSCASIFQAACYCPRRDDDGDYKTVVARAGGRQSLVVVLHCARVFLWAGVVKSLSACPTLKRCHHWWHHSILKGILGSLGLIYSECRGKPKDQSCPGSNAMLMVLPFLKGLLGSGLFGALGAWWDKLEPQRAERLRI
jgi:hypothetical protein